MKIFPVISIVVVAAGGLMLGSLPRATAPPEVSGRSALGDLVYHLTTLAGEPPDTDRLVAALRPHIGGQQPIDSYARHLLLPILARHSPEAALALAADSPPSQAEEMIGLFAGVSEDTRLLPLAIKLVGTISPEALAKILGPADATEIAEALAKLSDDARERYQNQLLAAWAETDPAGAWSAISQFDYQYGSGIAQHNVLQVWFQKDPAGASDEVLASGSTLGAEALRPAGHGLYLHDPGAAIKWVKEFGDAQRSLDAQRGIFSAIGSQPSTEVIAAIGAGAHLDFPDPQRALGMIAYSFARSDPEAAIDWFAGYTGDDRAEILPNITNTAGFKAPGALFEFLESGAVTPSEIGALPTTTLAGLAKNDLTRTLALLSDVSDEVAQEFAIGTTRIVSPSQAAEMLDVIAGSGDEIQSTTLVTATRWAAEDPVAATAWIAGMEPGETKNIAFENVIGQWAQHDTSAAVDLHGIPVRRPRTRTRSLRPRPFTRQLLSLRSPRLAPPGKPLRRRPPRNCILHRPFHPRARAATP